VNLESVKYNNDGLIPAIIQDAVSGEVLMMAYMNEESLRLSLETGRTHFWSRSRQKLWMKGETSGHIQEIKEIYLDCDMDALLIKVMQREAACHTGRYSCFFNKISENCDSIETVSEDRSASNDVTTRDNGEVNNNVATSDNKAAILKELYEVVIDRRTNPREGSYTNYLFDKGIDKILKKVGEEAAEVIIAAKNRSAAEVTYEVSDLLYHLIVMLVEQGIELDAVYDELRKRR
jgi:phosphoribosyl-ATP pyrophosphohydrolase/phosphoribosyl-AMP cyclohydrolase